MPRRIAQFNIIIYACQVDFALESFSPSHSMPSSYPH